MNNTMGINYNPKEWTPCPPNCAYCCDPFYGYPKPHLTQNRIIDGKSVEDVEKEQSKLEKEALATFVD